MAISVREHICLYGLLYVENSKFHRSSFNKKTNVHYWAYREKKNSNCKCFAKTVFISTASNESSDTVCPGSNYSNLYNELLYKLGNYFLDIGNVLISSKI